MSFVPVTSFKPSDWDYLAQSLLGVSRAVEQAQAAAARELITTCVADGCLVLLDERCPACAVALMEARRG